MNKSNLRALLTPIVLALAIVFGMMLNRFLPDRTQVSASSEMFLPVTGSKLDLIISMIQNSYVDTVDTRQIVENTIPVLLKDLDPHTVYIPAKDMQRANEGKLRGCRNPVLQVFGHGDRREGGSGWTFGESWDKGWGPDCSGKRFSGCRGENEPR